MGVVLPIAIILLSCAFAYAMWRNANRNKANDKITEAATRMEYEDPEGYANGGREAFLAQIKPKKTKSR